MTPTVDKKVDVRLLIRRQRLSGLHDGNSRVAEYESLLDLFTLISFILIFAAFIYVARSTESNQHNAATISKISENGSVALQDFPNDILLVTLYKENSADMLIVFNGATGMRKNLAVTQMNIASKMDELFANLSKTQKINFVIDDENQEASFSIVVKIERWFAKNNYNPKIYFSGITN